MYAQGRAGGASGRVEDAVGREQEQRVLLRLRDHAGGAHGAGVGGGAHHGDAPAAALSRRVRAAPAEKCGGHDARDRHAADHGGAVRRVAGAVRRGRGLVRQGSELTPAGRRAARRVA